MIGRRELISLLGGAIAVSLPAPRKVDGCGVLATCPPPVSQFRLGSEAQELLFD